MSIEHLSGPNGCADGCRACKAEADALIWLQEREQSGRADCGCILHAAYLDSGSPAFVMCKTHEAIGPAALALIKEIKSTIGHDHQAVKTRVKTCPACRAWALSRGVIL